MAEKDYEQSLQRLVDENPRDARTVHEALAGFVVEHAVFRGSLIVDDTGFPKHGRRTVGLAWQYSGTLDKGDNCQIGVALQYADGLDVFCLAAAHGHQPHVFTESVSSDFSARET